MSERIQIVITTTPDVVQIATEGPQGPSGGGGGGGGNTNLSYSATGTTVTIASDTGTDATILAASGTVAGVMTSTQFTKLDGIASGATVGATWGVNLGSIPSAITGTTASFTTALESKLSGMDPGATFGADWLDNLDNIPSVVAAMTSQTAAAQAIGKEALAAELLSEVSGLPKVGGLTMEYLPPVLGDYNIAGWSVADQKIVWFGGPNLAPLIGAEALAVTLSGVSPHSGPYLGGLPMDEAPVSAGPIAFGFWDNSIEKFAWGDADVMRGLLGLAITDTPTFAGVAAGSSSFNGNVSALQFTLGLNATVIYGSANPSVEITLPATTGTLALTSQLAGKQDSLVSGTNIKTINGASVLGSGDLTVTGGTKTLCRWIASEKGQPPASGFATLDTQNSVPYLAFADAVTAASVFQDWIPQGANLASGLDVTLTFAGSATSGGVRCDVAFEALTHAISGDSYDTVALGTATTGGTAWVPFSVTIRCTALDSLAAGGLFRVRVRRLGTDGADTYAATVGLLAVKIDQVA